MSVTSRRRPWRSPQLTCGRRVLGSVLRAPPPSPPVRQQKPSGGRQCQRTVRSFRDCRCGGLDAGSGVAPVRAGRPFPPPSFPPAGSPAPPRSTGHGRHQGGLAARQLAIAARPGRVARHRSRTNRRQPAPGRTRRTPRRTGSRPFGLPPGRVAPVQADVRTRPGAGGEGRAAGHDYHLTPPPGQFMQDIRYRVSRPPAHKLRVTSRASAAGRGAARWFRRDDA